MFRYLIHLIILIFMSCSVNHKNNILDEIVNSLQPEFPDVVSKPKKYRLQILYTQIDRNQKNEPIFSTFSFGVDTGKYFYPASCVKLPIAALALEKARSISKVGIYDRFEILPGPVYKSGVSNDVSSKSGYPSLAHSIRNLFIISDNSANNYLYDFLGRDHINQRLWDLGYNSARINHRLSLSLSDEENRFTHPINFYNASKISYQQKSQIASLSFDVNVKDFKIGKNHYVDGIKKEGPLDFSSKNFMNLHDQHELIKQIIFPNYFKNRDRFNLSDSDYSMLYREMSILPRESEYPSFPDYDKYYDGYCKFFLFGDTKRRIPDNIKIFNKIGLAYGFTIDNAYIVDLDNNVEFLLTAVIYSNSNEVMNDNVYDYEDVSIPFLSKLGRAIYSYELKREKNQLPNLGWVQNL